MTNKEIMVQILHEVTGQPKEEWERIVMAARHIHPDMTQGFDRQRTPAEAEDLLRKLRAEKAGILTWLVQGAMAAYIEQATPPGISTH